MEGRLGRDGKEGRGELELELEGKEKGLTGYSDSKKRRKNRMCR